MSETGMMAVNRYKLKNLANQGHTGAKLAQKLLAQTDKLLGVILLGNNLINSASASLATVITFRLFGQSEAALGIATVVVTFAILVVSEATPQGHCRYPPRPCRRHYQLSAHLAAEAVLSHRLVCESVC